METCSHIKKDNSARKILLTAGTILIAFLAGTSAAHSQTETDSLSQHPWLFGTGVDYLVPTRYSNPINTVSIHSFFRKRHLKNVSILMQAGLTTTYAWGYSRQWIPISRDTLQAFDYETSAFGAGPLLQIESTIIKARHFSILLEGSGSFVLYNNVFPYGGERYNFMARVGPSFAYKLNSRSFLKIGYRWMHVSNGKGYGNQNPFYEAHGVNVGVLWMR